MTTVSDTFFPLTLIVLLSLATTVLMVSAASTEISKDNDDEKLLKQIEIPTDVVRSPDEQYVERFIIRMKQGQSFVIAYWHQSGSLVGLAVDVFAVEKSGDKSVGRRVYSTGLGGEVLSVQTADFDEDGREDLLFIHRTGGVIVGIGATAARQTSKGFTEVFSYAGSDALVYRDRGQLHILVKEASLRKVKDYVWDPAKQTFVVARTFDLLY